MQEYCAYHDNLERSPILADEVHNVCKIGSMEEENYNERPKMSFGKRKCGLRSIDLPDIILIVNLVTLQEPTV